jgi:hypothetical protein
MQTVRLLILALPLALLGGTTQADTLVMESVATAPENSPSGIERPGGGVSMTQVEKRYGMPAERLPAVGDPPITRWEYDTYTVYFEHDRVIHSVVHPNAR